MRLRPWQRLGVRLAVLFAVVTLLAVGATGVLVHERQKHEIEETLGAQLLNIARTAVLLVDGQAHADLQAAPRPDAEAYARIQEALAAVRTEAVLPTPLLTIADYDLDRRQARVVVASDGSLPPGAIYPLAEEMLQPLGWTIDDEVARVTRIYRNAQGTWITAFAPILDASGGMVALLAMDYPVDLYLDRLGALRASIVQASLAAGAVALLLGLLFARQLTRPISALTRGVARVAGGDLTQVLPVRSRDEVGHLTRAFNEMVDGLRQRDFIRATFGRYVSPEVVRTLLESPGGLRFGGEKRVVTILMTDLRGYTRFAERGDPAWVMEVLNGYLARMTDIVIEHGGTINEFIGDAIFAIFGAPLALPDHAERAAACALAMQRAMVGLNEEHARRGLPRFEMGIGINTGEAVVGNIGSEQRAKYAVVGSAVNVAARVEAATVGGQVFLSAATHQLVAQLAEVAGPVPVEVKGLSEPLLLYELQALGGRWGLRLPDPDDGRARAVRLPLVCWRLDGKVVRSEGLSGTVERADRRSLDVRLPAALAPLTNVRLRMAWPAAGESGDLYGKVVAGAAEGLLRIRLTSIDPADEKALVALVEG